MQINKSSWHYRFLNSVFNTVPRSLCPYFWKVVWGIVLIGSGLITIIGLCGVFGAKLLTGFGLYGGLVSIIASPIVGVLFLSFVISLIVGFLILWDHLKQVYRNSAEKKIRSSSGEGSLVGSFLKAKKEKICPTLDFVE